MSNDFHKPALLQETIEYLKIKPGKWYVDATLGGGGHTEAILNQGGKVLGIDFDKEAIDYTKEKLGSKYDQTYLKLVKANFTDIEVVLRDNNIDRPSGILFDLGTSLHQLTSRNRGFSFSRDENLDMRMNLDLKVKALDLINCLNLHELDLLFSKLGEERLAKEISKQILTLRQQKPISRTSQLALLVEKIYLKKGKKTKIHPATKVFQALRIAVNDELNNLKTVLPIALKVLAPKGRLVVISWHSLEDKIVKDFYKKKEKNNMIKFLTKKPIRPKSVEIRMNIRCRSARLRSCQKI